MQCTENHKNKRLFSYTLFYNRLLQTLRYLLEAIKTCVQKGYLNLTCNIQATTYFKIITYSEMETDTRTHLFSSPCLFLSFSPLLSLKHMHTDRERKCNLPLYLQPI